MRSGPTKGCSSGPTNRRGPRASRRTQRPRPGSNGLLLRRRSGTKAAGQRSGGRSLGFFQREAWHPDRDQLQEERAQPQRQPERDPIHLDVRVEMLLLGTLLRGKRVPSQSLWERPTANPTAHPCELEIFAKVAPSGSHACRQLVRVRGIPVLHQQGAPSCRVRRWQSDSLTALQIHSRHSALRGQSEPSVVHLRQLQPPLASQYCRLSSSHPWQPEEEAAQAIPGLWPWQPPTPSSRCCNRSARTRRASLRPPENCVLIPAKSHLIVGSSVPYPGRPFAELPCGRLPLGPRNRE